MLVDRLERAAADNRVVSFDTETTSLEPMLAKLVGLSFADEPGTGYYIPLAHEDLTAAPQLQEREVLAALKGWFANPNAPKVAQNAKYDLHVLLNHGVEVAGLVADTMLESYVLEAHKTHGMDALALRWLNHDTIKYEDVAGKGAAQIGFAQVPVERATQYAAEDSEVTLRLHHVLSKALEAEPELKSMHDRVELPFTQVLFEVERHGVLIDPHMLEKQSEEIAIKLKTIEEQAFDMAGGPFNLNSPKQIGELLFGKLGLPVVKKTASGTPSTDEEVLTKLAEDYPLPARILEHRGLTKLKGTYTDKLAQMALPRTGRVHTHYAQAVAVTGRLSSNDPNLQNIPIRTAEGRKVREAFVAPAGNLIASADYSQIELRIMAHLSDDAALLKAFHEGLDVHKATAAEVFGATPDTVSSEQRRYAKTINFGLIYGMSAFGLAKALGIDNTAAKNYITRYFERFAGVKRYMDETREQAKAKGYVETVFGRRLMLPEINSPNGPRRAGAERAAINAPMQGTAADLIKLSMVAVQKALDEQGKATKVIMQVHDELVFEVPESEVEWVRTEVPRIMAGVANLKVPLLAEVGFGPNWEQAH